MASMFTFKIDLAMSYTEKYLITITCLFKGLVAKKEISLQNLIVRDGFNGNKQGVAIF